MDRTKTNSLDPGAVVDGDYSLTVVGGKVTGVSAAGGAVSIYHHRERLTADAGHEILTLGASPGGQHPAGVGQRFAEVAGHRLHHQRCGEITFGSTLSAGEIVAVAWESETETPDAATLVGTGVTAITVRATSTVYTTTNTAAVTIPATAQVGELLVVSTGDSWGSNNVPTGWTRFVQNTGSNMNGAVFYKVCAIGDPGSTVNFTFGGAHQATAICVVVQGSHQGSAASMWNQRGISGGTLSSTSHSAAAKDLLLHFGHWRQPSSTGTADKGILSNSVTGSLGRAAIYDQPVSGSLTQTVAWTAGTTSGYFYASIKIAAIGN